MMHMLTLVSAAALDSQLSTVAIATLVSLFIPLLVGLITKKTASSLVKVIVNVIAVALTAVVALWISGIAVDWQIAVNTFILSLVTSISAYKGVWLPSGIAETVANSTTGIIGSDTVPTPEPVEPV